ncbi:hypothetical protein SAMD00019534_079200 [Acytostelium subglobosum LB1]|uniref:hypothetical protein n=1 Tax=Acytostelium subglobosum LB1 TaxID=1410327 RepID=UPI00064519D2|nr:hypothetical protein SAMD00019534_079200 [Acytostelium subglobosum LB1]GAM24745.1 hypothetical protein SAMD00019534_079200 [Acytostelium subglobosum LB1]|eukprot:XP_012752414.1 hypothetical protein SAMD00019534_079200 [Acytostelium subglobosum LB1]
MEPITTSTPSSTDYNLHSNVCFSIQEEKDISKVPTCDPIMSVDLKLHDHQSIKYKKKTKNLFVSILSCFGEDTCIQTPANDTLGSVVYDSNRVGASANDDFSNNTDAVVPDKYQVLLPPMMPITKGLKTLVIDLDETLVHAAFKPVPNPDVILEVEMDTGPLTFYVCKRPHLDEFLDYIHGKFEIVVFTASLAIYADKLLNIIDKKHVIQHRLFRDSCILYNGNYTKDLSVLGRDLKKTMIIDNSPHAYQFNPENAIPIGTWIKDRSDRQLIELIPLLDHLQKVTDVRTVLEERYSS